jgi:hypothetical protein
MLKLVTYVEFKSINDYSYSLTLRNSEGTVLISLWQFGEMIRSFYLCQRIDPGMKGDRRGDEK